MYAYPVFNIEIVRDLHGRALRWPDPEEAEDERNLGCNREYMDLRDLDLDEAERVYALEGEFIARIEASDAPEAEHEGILDELYEDPDPGLYGLDLGVASSVIALSAIGCVPFSSCNAGVYGGSHHERHPLVAFFAKQAAAPFLLACAEKSGVGLETEDTGALLVYSTDIRAMRRFAEVLMSKE